MDRTKASANPVLPRVTGKEPKVFWVCNFMEPVEGVNVGPIDGDLDVCRLSVFGVRDANRWSGDGRHAKKLPKP